MSAGQPQEPYELGERVGSSSWKALERRTGRTVVLKVLSKQLPREPGRRDAFLREVRVAAALYHSFLVPLQEIVTLGDNLVLVMSLIEGESFSKRTAGKPLGRSEFFRLAYQLAEAIRFLHSKNLVHGNINADSVMVTADGQLRLGGFNLGNLLPRPDGISAAYQQKGSDIRSVAYMAPEQITGQPVDPRSDVYSAGVVMYEMSTGKLPMQADNAPDMARRIVEGQPASPKNLNPEIDNAILGILGRCLFKDPYRRHKDGKAVLEDVAKADPDAVRFANEFLTRASAPVAAAVKPDSRQAVLLLADVANYDALAASDHAAATRAAARMQQIVGEAAYLFDGQVLDPFATVAVAEMPSVESALEAARKAEFDLSYAASAGDMPAPVRLLLHAGPVVTADGKLSGEGVEGGAEVLGQIPPLQLLITEAFMTNARGSVRVRDAGARGGVKLYSIVPAEPPPLELPPEEEPVDSVGTVAVEPGGPAELEARPKRPRWVLPAAAAVLLSLVGVGAAFVFSGKPEPAKQQPVAVTTPAAPAFRKVLIDPFKVEGTDAALTDLARAIQLSVLEILRNAPDVSLADAAAPDVTSYTATMRTGATGPELVTPNGVTTAVPDAATGIRSVLDWLGANARVSVRDVTQSAEALNSFATGMRAVEANDDAKAEPAIRAAIAADPNFLPAQALAMRYFSAKGKLVDALAASKQVMLLQPANLDAARRVARLALAEGDVQSAFAGYAAVLRRDPADIEALTQVGRYAASANDSARFMAAVNRLKSMPPSLVPIHAPDIVVAGGRMEAALEPYYEIETGSEKNAALSLKIGRIAVLRHSLPIAEIELKKLESADSAYGLPLLKAYVAAEQRNKAEAEAQLETAGAGSIAGDDYWTSVAEVYAILGERQQIIESLRRAIARKEPTSTYIMTNPLFSFLRNEADFRELHTALLVQQAEVRNALAQIPL